MAERFDIEKYLKDLSPEQQEKAKACKNKDELIKLAAEEDIEIPMEALESVAGGCGTALKKCPQGGEHEWKKIGFETDPNYATYECRKCRAKVVSSGSLE